MPRRPAPLWRHKDRPIVVLRRQSAQRLGIRGLKSLVSVWFQWLPLRPSRRTALVEWAQRTGGYVIEDDYDGEFRYDRQPVGALQGLDPDRVSYLGSASKSLSPVLRLGWMVIPDDLMDDVIAAAGGQQFYVNAIDQLTMADFITRGQYDWHIRRMRGHYRRRRDALLAALGGFDVGISGLPAGLHLLLSLPDGAGHAVLRRSGEAGVALAGPSWLRHPLPGKDTPHQDGIVVNFGAPADHAFAAAVEALRGVLSASGLGGQVCPILASVRSHRSRARTGS